ncbi:MAG: cation:proton antiporter [Cyanobacteriota bacterium]|nr:cation:proton antiporter [Cyanobacteriota bacterium]
MATPSLLSTLLVLLVGLAIARLMAGKLARWAVPAIVVELAIGFLLGNTVVPFAAIQPLSGITELGVLTLFFQVGLEVRADLLSSRRNTILRLVALSFLVPLLAYGPLVQWFAMAPATALLCLACLSATGTGVTLRLLAQRQALSSPSGRLLVGVSVLDDLPAIALLSLAVASAGGALGPAGFAPGFGSAAPLVGVAIAAASYQASGWWARHRGSAPTSPLAILMVLIGSAWVGEASGLTSLLGALWAGVLLNRLSPPTRALSREVSEMLAVLSDVFLPLYFISVGMRVNLAALLEPRAWTLAPVLLVLALLSKLACGLGVSAADRRAGIDRWLVVFGLLPRGLPGLVFATAALSAEVIDAVQFSALIIMVAVTTVVGLLLLERRLLQLGGSSPFPSSN